MLQEEILAAIVSVVLPAVEAGLLQGLTPCPQCLANALPLKKRTVERLGERLGTGVAHWPIGAEVVRNAPAQERFGQPYAVSDAFAPALLACYFLLRSFLARLTAAHASRLTSVEEDQGGQMGQFGEVSR